MNEHGSIGPVEGMIGYPYTSISVYTLNTKLHTNLVLSFLTCLGLNAWSP